MPRYYFHIVNGHTELDAEGAEFDSLQEARDNAVRFAGAVIAEECRASLWKGQSWALCVTDAPHLSGAPLFTLNFSAKENDEQGVSPT
jgi:hypothetical protein